MSPACCTIGAPIPCATCHRDGTVTYWSPRTRGWIEGAREVPADALAVLPQDEADRVRRHLWRAMGVRS